MSHARTLRLAGGVMAALSMALPAGGAVAPERTSSIARKEFRHPRLLVQTRLQRVEEQPASARAGLLGSLARLGVTSHAAYLDPRTGRFATLLPAEPLLPGTGQGNGVRWSDLGVEAPAAVEGWKQAAWSAFVSYVNDRSAALKMDPAELAQPGNVAVHDDGAVVQIHAPRVFRGVPVRDSYVTAVINHGNLVLLGAHNWGTIEVDARPTVTSEQAEAALSLFLREASPPSDYRRQATLAMIPMANGPADAVLGLDNGLSFRLVWVLSPEFAGDPGTWEALVDAHSGEVIAFTDTNQYQSVRRVQGGVYPVSNDQVPPAGTEQPGWPFPYAGVAVASPSGSFFTDSGGNLPVCADGNITSTLNGRYVRIVDACGPISLTGTGNLDFGVSAGTDCTTPGLGGFGNTHAARSAFYHLNKMVEQALSRLPDNDWIKRQLRANMDITPLCNGFWNGNTVNLERGFAPSCHNPGEIASFVDHEWGHGLDNNGVNPTISLPGEGIADIYAALRLRDSCVARNVFNTSCGGYGDPCLTCTGVRDIDWAQHASGQPHDITWIDANCPTLTTNGPCGGGVHCEGSVYAESVWDLLSRDLPAIHGMSGDTALEVATRTTYLGAGPVGTVFQCVQGSGGCPATGAYLNFLAVDDDDGDITDGTPHGAAIFTAFNRHGIACPTPVITTNGCPNAPTAAPVVTVAGGDTSASLSWAAVPGAVKYDVFRTEGVSGCNFGKVLLGETFGTTWADQGLQNGRQYFYTVAALGLADSCFGPMSACAQVTPAAGANLSADLGAMAVIPTTGDGDPFIDNCEDTAIEIPVTNTGSVTQTNVRVAVQPLSHPGMAINIGSPHPSLAPCESVVRGFTFKPVDLVLEASIRFRVDITSDQMTPAVRSYVVEIGGAEGDTTPVPTQTFDFESGAEGWAQATGTFNRTNAAPGGAGGAGTFYWQSSSGLDRQCDEVQSPIVLLTPTSTLSLQNNHEIEPLSSGQWWDRANLGLLRLNGTRTVVSPSGGRLYEASGVGGWCGLDQEPGWAGANPTWGASSWTPAALNAASFVNQPIRLSIRYGTDPGGNGFGFRFDQVTLTNFLLKVADTQSDQCLPGNTPPVAVPDTSNSPSFGPVAIPVLANDSDPEGQCIRVGAVTQPASGVAVANFVGCPNLDTVTYIPNPACGPPCNDSFQYTVTDGNGGTASTTVTINQVPVELQTFKVE